MYVVVYLDDIMIYSDNPDRHLRHVREVLRRLRAFTPKSRSARSAWTQRDSSVLFLALTAFQWIPRRSKSSATGRRPRNAKDVQSFLGFANFYRRFIVSYRYHCPTHSAYAHGRPVVWSPQCEDAFNFGTHPTISTCPVVDTDASDHTIAGILSVRTADGQVHPVAFFSRTLSGAELNYDTYDKEPLAIFEAFKNWRHCFVSPPIEST